MSSAGGYSSAFLDVGSSGEQFPVAGILPFASTQ